MPRPRKPKMLAVIDGTAAKDPQRYRDRPNPLGAPLGDPPAWLGPEAVQAWRELEYDLPWLRRPHRSLLALTAYLQGRLTTDPDPKPADMVLFKQCLGMLGASPSDESKISLPDDTDEADEFFH